MKVMMINSPWVDDPEKYSVKAGARWAHIRSRKKTMPYYPFPFAMAYSAALLQKNRFDIRLLDAIAMEWTTRETLNEIAVFKPEVTVIETSTPSIYSDLSFVKAVREISSGLIVLSGPHATALPDEVLNESPADAVLRGEYDETLLELCSIYADRKSFESIQGLSYKNNGIVHHNPNRPLIGNLDDLPYPMRDQLPMKRYTDPACRYFPNVSMLTSRGCPHRCLFCLESTVFFHTPSFRRRNAGKIVDEMEYIENQYGAREVYFDDSSFTASHEHARDVAEEIIRRRLNIPWSCMADAQVDDETLGLMRRAGCVGLKFGVETADPGIMHRINKHLDLNRVSQFARNARRLGFYTHGTFMFGLPGETRQSIRKTIDFAFSLGCTTAQFSVATPFPGTAFYEMALQEGWLTTTDWSCFNGGDTPVISYPECSAQDIVDGLETAKKRKIRKLLYHPGVLCSVIVKLYKIKGLLGLTREIATKIAYLFERSDRSNSCR